MPKPSAFPPYGDTSKASFAWLVVVTACIANFLDLFQISMVLFGLAEINTNLGFTAFDVNWVLVSYSVTFATFLLTAGQAADHLGLRTTFLTGTGTLVWSNVLCSWTPNRSGLLAGRALAGVGAAFTTSTGISIISHVLPEGKSRNAGLAAYVSCGPIGTVLGVVIGALLTASPAGWRSLFWVTLIFAAFAFILGLFIPRFEIPAEKKATRIDYLGLGAFTAGTALLVYGLNDAENRGWKSPAIVVTIILGTLALASFPIIESNISNPAIPSTILRSRHVLVPLSIFMCIGGGWVTWFFISTQIALNSLKYKTVLAAAYCLPATFAAMVAGGIGNALINKGYAKLVIVGGYVISIGALVPWGVIGPQYGVWYTIVFAALYLFASPPVAIGAQAIVLNQIPLEMHGTASAHMNVMYQFGSSLFLAVVHVVIKAKTIDTTPQGLLVGYHYGVWALLAFTAAGLVGFVVLYLPTELTSAGVSKQDHKCRATEDDVSRSQRKD